MVHGRCFFLKYNCKHFLADSQVVHGGPEPASSTFDLPPQPQPIPPPLTVRQIHTYHTRKTQKQRDSGPHFHYG